MIGHRILIAVCVVFLVILVKMCINTWYEMENLRLQNKILIMVLSNHQIIKESMESAYEKSETKFQPGNNSATDNLEKQKFKSCSVQEPEMQYEVRRRRAIRDIREMSNYLNSELKSLISTLSNNESIKIMERMMNVAGRHKSSLLHHLSKLKEVDGFSAWRSKKENELSNIVQKRFTYLQNPKNCTKAKKIVCRHRVPGCGFGCQVHHLVLCLTIAYGTKRTLVMNTTGWNYKTSLDAFFEPLNNRCTTYDERDVVAWPGTPYAAAIRIPHILEMWPRPEYLPLAIPKDISIDLVHVHGDPAAWWLNQLLKFVLRPTKTWSAIAKNMLEEARFQNPIIGIHIRRTDKLMIESTYHNLSEYMEHVEDFYQQMALTNSSIARRVYLATDDISALRQMKERYPSYTVLTNPKVTKLASSELTRYNSGGLLGIMLDIHFLSRCDYVVCTFSSNICRMAYEIGQSVRPDAWTRYHSLDDMFEFSILRDRFHFAVYSYQRIRPGDMSLEPGDVIKIMKNLWNGYSVGWNQRTLETGLYPSFMAVDVIDAISMPTYFDVDQ